MLRVVQDGFASPDPSVGAGVDNYGNYRNPEVDLAVAEALRQVDPSDRLPALQRGLRTALSDVAWVPLYFSRETLLVRRPFAYGPRADGLVRLADIRRAP